MIVHVRKDIPRQELERLALSLKAAVIEKDERFVLVGSSSAKGLNGHSSEWVEEHFVFPSDMQLSSLDYFGGKRTVQIGSGPNALEIGGDSRNTAIITGPCSVESEEQIDRVAQFLVERGIKALRAGAFKPRTSPYSFQGLGVEGLKLLAEMRRRYGLWIVSEVRDATHIEEVIEYADVIQVGAKAMYDQGVLRRCGKADKPVLIKRGFGTTLQEFVQAAEFVLSNGNDDVILCERGIRTFETKTRFTLDLCGVAWLKAHTNLPVILDPSHAMGYRYGVPDLTRASAAMGVDGLLIETHPNPEEAKSDAAQQLDFDMFAELQESLRPVVEAVGYSLI